MHKNSLKNLNSSFVQQC